MKFRVDNIDIFIEGDSETAIFTTDAPYSNSVRSFKDFLKKTTKNCIIIKI